MSDDLTTVSDLKESVQQFCEERDWDQYHDPKELSIGILTEAGELVDHFRFKSEDDMEELLAKDEKRDAIREELADVLYFVLRFGQMYDVDLSTALEEKIELNEEKYPVEQAKGDNRKYTELEE